MLYVLTILLSAFLLFQIQPMIAKVILPIFGGGAAIWTVCLLFFQGLLLLGYLYAHGLSQLKQFKHQLMIHGSLLVASTLMLPMALSANSMSVDVLSTTPIKDILFLLTLTIGLPYFTLSATGPLIQRWQGLSQTNALPYKLYSVSNLGSLVALISYPFLFEPWMALSAQGQLWSASYAVLVLLFLGLIINLFKQHATISEYISVEKAEKTSQPLLTPILWLVLSALGVMLLLSTTNAMTQNIPPVPFLWILPLCLYLITFIICFHSPKWYVRSYWLALFLLSAFAAILMFFIGSQFDLISQTLVYSFILFTACMLCHGELVKLKPSTARLTQFYLFMSLGGFLGSVFVSIVAEQIFVQFTEFPLAIMATLVAFIVCFSIENKPLKIKKWLINSGLVTSLVLLAALFIQMQTQFDKYDVAKVRNFYGLLKVVDVEIKGEKERRLIDGTTSHGTQSLVPDKANIARSYYRKDTGVALALEKLLPVGLAFEPLNVGIIGLGAGTLAAYGKPQEYYKFYELNPAVKDFAQQHFSYLNKSKAIVDIALGDGRSLLQQELSEYGSQDFDVLVVDAFSGDAIPTHLLTEQAFKLYWQHIKRKGILALHISNTHIDLTALTRSLATTVNKQAIYIKTQADNTSENDAQWVLITNNQQFLTSYSVRQFITPWPQSAMKEVIWTDDYSNLLLVLK